jgi:putative membrane-bound dehydrogenase-like protein
MGFVRIASKVPGPWHFGLAFVSALLSFLLLSPQSTAQTGPGEGREGLVELSKFDPRLKGHYAPKGIKVEIIAAEPTIIDPTGMAFADDGTLYVAEWRSADHMYDTWDTVKLPEGGSVRVTRRRKATTDIVKRLRDTNGDGVYDQAEVVVDGAEMPSAIFPWGNSLYLTCVGRLERWTDTDGDGRFETRSIVADGFCGFYHHWLSGMVLNSDGWFYLTAGDNDNHVVGSDGSRVEISRCGGVFRGRVDGSQMNFFAMGFRNPYRNLTFNSTFDPFLVDNDQEDGSKFQGCRLINPVEGGDYGWRLMPGALCCVADFDRGAVDGERPGKLPIITKTGRGAPAGLVAYNGVALPEAYRDLIIYPDVFRKLVRGYRVKPQGGANVLADQVTLMTADDDLFRPCQTVIGADGALYVLDWRSNSGGAGRLWGDGKYGRLYRLSWEGDGKTPALPLKANNWNRVINASEAELMAMLRDEDLGEARRAQREVVERAKANGGDRDPAQSEPTRIALITLMNDATAPPHARLLGLQGVRQLWNTLVEEAMLGALDDPDPVIRRLAAQSISWEPQDRRPGLVPALVAHLNEKDGRVLREIALAIGQHGWSIPFDAAPTLLAWLMAHPDEDVVTRDAFIRALERLGDPGVQAIAEAVRSRSPETRAKGVALFAALRTEAAAKILPTLVTLPELSGSERLALVNLYKDIPLNIPMPTQGLADWVASHPETTPAVKVATLDVCRLAGNPASRLVLTLLDDADESVRLAATRLAAQSKPEGSMPKLLARVAEKARSSRERTAIAQALRAAGPSAFDALKAAMEVFPDDASFRRIVLRALADVDRVKAAPIAQAALKDASSDVRDEAIQILGETPQSALLLGQAYLDGVLDRGRLPAVLAALRKYSTPDQQKLLQKIESEAAKATISAADLKARYEKGVDPWRGLSVYLRESGSRCFTCHKIENMGGNVGPALTGVYQALSLDKLIESILEPSKEIKEGYESLKVALNDGRVLTGIRVTQDDKTLVLKDANAQETRIAVDDIDEQAKDSVSLMPVGLVQDLAPQEVADLLGFLLNKGAQETLKNRQQLDHFLAIGPFARGGDDQVIALDRIEADKAYSGQDGQTVTWVPLDTDSRGSLNLRGQFGPSAGKAFLSLRLKSPQAQESALSYALSGALRIYLNGEKVADTSTPGLVHLPLKAGDNTLVIALDRPANEDFRGVFELFSAFPVEAQPR